MSLKGNTEFGAKLHGAFDQGQQFVQWAGVEHILLFQPASITAHRNWTCWRTIKKTSRSRPVYRRQASDRTAAP